MKEQRISKIDRRTFLKYTGSLVGGGAIIGFPAILKGAEPPEIKIGAIQPLTGPLAEIGQSCRQGNEMAVEEINAKGGIKSLGGAKLKLLQGDSESKEAVGRSEAERLIREGAAILTGAFQSGVSLAIATVAEQRQIPYIIDISAADEITQRGYKYVFRNFPTTSTLGRNGVQYQLDIFKATGMTPKRAVITHTSDLFGTTQANKFQEFHKKLNAPYEIVEVIAYPEATQDLSTEVAKIKAAKPDLLCPITRLRDAILLIRELFKQRVEFLAIMGPGSPGLYETEFINQLGKLADYTMDNAPWYNPANPQTKQAAEAYEKKHKKSFDTNSGYSFEGVMVIGDVLGRAGSTDPGKIVEAIRKTNITDHVMIGGPIVFNENGDNPNASSALTQILQGKTRIVFPDAFAETKYTFPVPKLWERG
ncbi:MAG: ABC transporter substrate-binding protein [Candidatus Tectomicrobia bacterium]|nr:ABC transporter substrate-binding protein [Candidatus Tectomicrobia bacterium]